MKRIIALVAAALLFAQPSFAQQKTNASYRSGAVLMNDDGTLVNTINPLGYTQYTSVSSATALTLPSGATFCVVSPETQAVRWRDDGTNPTASVGMEIKIGSSFTFNGALILAAVKFIEQAASAKLNVACYK